MDKYVVVLAAGKGTGMNSRDPEHSKVSYPILGKPIINYVIDAVKPLDPKQIVTVVGFGGELTAKLVEGESDVVWQKRLLGTGHAVLQAKPFLELDRPPIRGDADISDSSVGKEPTCNAGDPGLIPGIGRSTGEGRRTII